MRILKVAVAAVLVCAALFFMLRFLFRGDSLETAVNRFEDREYISAIKILNRLIPAADYEAGEKIYYYRARALNKLAESLEKEYEEELRGILLEKKPDPRTEKLKRRLEEKLKDANRETGGDLLLRIDKKGSRIVPRGKFSDDFASRYRGSRFIEDLDFEELQKIERTERDKLPGAISRFYEKYPDTLYLSQLVKILFDNMQKGSFAFRGNEEFLRNIIIQYALRYPTSSEFHRIYTCSGDNVNVRNSPGTEGKVVGKIRKEEILVQLEKSMDTSQIGDTRDYWFRVAGLGGTQGWIFGKFLLPLDLSKYKKSEVKVNWSFEEHFTEWSDSNTPRNWVHLENGDPAAISFTVKGEVRTVRLNSPKGKSAGLFRRITGAHSFHILARARFIAGDGMTLFAYVTAGGQVYQLKLREEEVEVSGRKIPLHTSDWHDYLLSSDDGRFARFYVDGEMISSRIPALPGGTFTAKGLYCLYSGSGETVSGELEYVKVRH